MSPTRLTATPLRAQTVGLSAKSFASSPLWSSHGTRLGRRPSAGAAPGWRPRTVRRRSPGWAMIVTYSSSGSSSRAHEAPSGKLTCSTSSHSNRRTPIRLRTSTGPAESARTRDPHQAAGPLRRAPARSRSSRPGRTPGSTRRSISLRNRNATTVNTATNTTAGARVATKPDLPRPRLGKRSAARSLESSFRPRLAQPPAAPTPSPVPRRTPRNPCPPPNPGTRRGQAPALRC